MQSTLFLEVLVKIQFQKKLRQQMLASVAGLESHVVASKIVVVFKSTLPLLEGKF